MNHLGVAFAIAAAIAFPSTAGLAEVRPAVALSTPPGVAEHSYSGTLQSRRHLVLTIRLRSGQLLLVDATQANLQKRVTEPLAIGESLIAQGILVAGALIAGSVVATTAPARSWAPDR